MCNVFFSVVVAVFFFPHCIENKTTSVRAFCVRVKLSLAIFLLSIKTYEKF